MGREWSSLSLYESVDLVRRFAEERTGRRPPEAKAREIAAHFSQGREFFRGAAGAGELVRPLILYYGAVALARGAVLYLDAKKTKVEASHGLHASGWRDFLTRPGALADSEVRVKSGGTFAELARVTANTERTPVLADGLPRVTNATARGTKVSQDKPRREARVLSVSW